MEEYPKTANDENSDKNIISNIPKHAIKDFVYEYIHSKSLDNPIKVSNLTNNSIFENLYRTEKISKKDVKNALQELVDDKSVRSLNLQYTIYITPSGVNNLTSEDRRNISIPLFINFAVGYLILILI
ncbi:hypothetical protein HYX09_05665, partial [Candidatus Woesearchaeota archaeon]|nr:hypothetical protein [Candidatus Woesearchaeota archaeon]